MRNRQARRIDLAVVVKHYVDIDPPRGVTLPRARLLGLLLVALAAQIALHALHLVQRAFGLERGAEREGLIKELALGRETPRLRGEGI